MKIGIELRQVVAGLSGGIVPLLKGVLDAFFEDNPDHDFFVFCTIYNRSLLNDDGENTHFYSLATDTYWQDVDKLCLENSIDVLFRSYPIEDTLQFPMSKQIFMIPDIQHEFFPHFFTPDVIRLRRLAFNRALTEAGAICTISEYTLKTLNEYKWTRCKDIFLVSPALQLDYAKKTAGGLTEAEKETIPANDFFLYPANLWPHKNHGRVLEAFARFLDVTGRDMEFVFTGHPDGWSLLKSDFPNLPIKHLGFVSPHLLCSLFQKATALVFFSLYEGFGIPLLEAFHHGTPVICSNTTSLLEVGGKAVLSCNPTDVEAMSSLMAKIVTGDAALREQLILKGKERLGYYTWNQSALNLLNGCKRVASGANFDKTANRMRLTVQEPPLVSIVTPSYNQGRFLKRTIESVLGQSYPHIEYMVMDGDSTDDSVEILKSYNDQFYWVSEPDGGQTAAINKGLARSNGQIQAYLNSDDVLLPDSVAKIVDYFGKNPLTDMVYGLADYIDEDDNFIGPYKTDDYSFAKLMNDCCVCQPATFWRQRIAEKVGPFNEELEFAMDYEYWLRIDRTGGKIFHLHDKLACSRLYDDTKTLSSRSEIYQEIFKICDKYGGFVSNSHLHGFWHHRIFECETSWLRFFRKVPGFANLMAKIFSKKQLVSNIRKDAVLRRMIHAGSGSMLLRLLFFLEWPHSPFHRLIQIIGRKHVFMRLFPDNSMAPVCSFVPRRSLSNQDYYFVGVTPVDTVVIIKHNGKNLTKVPMKTNQQQKINFSLPTNTTGVVKILFNCSFLDKLKRRSRAFQLIDTNFFFEEDVVL